jgi:signal peptidase II
VLLSLAAVIAVVFSLRPYRLGLWAKLSLLSILGGMAGNLTDRIFMGFVVDMFDFTFVRFAIFNVADMFISFGAVFLCISLLFRPDDWRRKGEKAQAS